jgi:uncharacterized protein (TIGR02217 family)
MSSSVYPSLPGLMFPVGRAVVPPAVTIRTTPSEREYRARDATIPRYRYTLGYEFLRAGARGTELATLVGFYNLMGGPFDTFLFTDPDDHAVTANAFGTGDGATVAFQLLRSFGGFAEPVWDVNGAPSIYVAGTLKTVTTDYTISASGVVTFTAAPTAGQSLTWTGNFYRRCRFESATLDTSKFMADLFEAKSVSFISAKQ